MGKIKKDKSNTWKPLKLEGAFLAEGIDGLIGIEELTDYSLEKGTKKRKATRSDDKSDKGKKKKKAQDLNDQIDDDEENEHSAQKKRLGAAVKREKVKPKKKKQTLRDKRGVKQPDIIEEESGIGSDSESNLDKNEPKVDAEDEILVNPGNLKSDINVYSWTSLGVPEILVKALADQGFQAPTPIQALTLAPAILGRRDILGAAETGSGKTLAFGLPILNGILEAQRKEVDEINESNNSSETGDQDPSELKESENEDDEDIHSRAESSNEEDSDSEDFIQRESEEDNEQESDFEEREEIIGNEMLNAEGIGCVRAIDNIMINDSHGFPKKPLYALILTPTRELAIQVKNHLVKAAKYTGIRIAVVVGGMAAVKQERILSKSPEIVVATPGRLWELIQEGNTHLNQVDDVKFLAIDETDRMVERGHFQELHSLLEKINMNSEKMKKRQSFVFSATLTMVHDIPQHLSKKKNKHRNKIQKFTPEQKLKKVIEMIGISNPKVVDVTKQSGTAASLTECRIACTIDHKDYYLYYLLKRHAGRTLVFCNSIGCVRRLATLLEILECNPLPLHASMQQRQRLKNLERFQANENGVLIATDVAARGLDIPNVEHVIHYQVPRTSEGYVHRSGRTARAQKEGITILLMEPSEMQYYTRLCKTLGKTQDIPTFPVVDRLLIAVKERVNLSREIDRLELLCRRDNAQKGWLHKAVEDMDLVLDEDQLESTMEVQESADLKRQLKARRRQLKSLLTKPLFPKGFSGKYLDSSIEFQLDQGAQKAVDVMKHAIEEKPKKNKRITPGIPKPKRVSKVKFSRKRK
ncbi:ATP-dependent RNA helicase DDX24 isoform X2 [Diprion similis]|uniref:ATP-dependent RNA helicase DDX24 isoform X2 n=1 Tax=Diprion similis TaxID=362088 RepID=UPI001EF7F3BB|nr:ATP-dependent RNA helicase DDX24 isoform X2 [Diprion similis]